mmetsp:Transcript_21396/g.65322  ORF Transcript_21396/g.65322 Transcript_21396/m.65322 type:complete len:250 (-) Transcript_21396:2569-3318(-)
MATPSFSCSCRARNCTPRPAGPLRTKTSGKMSPASFRGIGVDVRGAAAGASGWLWYLPSRPCRRMASTSALTNLRDSRPVSEMPLLPPLWKTKATSGRALRMLRRSGPSCWPLGRSRSTSPQRRTGSAMQAQVTPSAGVAFRAAAGGETKTLPASEGKLQYWRPARSRPSSCVLPQPEKLAWMHARSRMWRWKRSTSCRRDCISCSTHHMCAQWDPRSTGSRWQYASARSTRRHSGRMATNRKSALPSL